MKVFRSVILAHHPGDGLADFGVGVLCQLNNARVELLDGRVVFFHARFDLGERVLDVARMAFVGEILGDLFV
jgi:hypothetical protein